MKIYSQYGFNEFVVLLEYKRFYIKEYFANYFLHQSDLTIDMKNGKMEILNNSRLESNMYRYISENTGYSIKKFSDIYEKEYYYNLKVSNKIQNV